MSYMQYYEMMGYPTCPPIGQCPTANLESMYPEVYNRVYPMVRHMCDMMDHPHNPEMYPCPRRETVDRMVDDIYMRTMMEMGGQYENWEPMEQQQMPEFGPGFGPGFRPGFRPGFGRRGFLGDLISIILIRELLFRRGRRF